MSTSAAVPSTKKTLLPSKRSMFGRTVEVAVPEPGEQVVADRRVRVQHRVVGARQAVVGDPALRDPQHGRHPELLQPERPARQR